jgi:fructoselysine 6-kinase
MKFIAFTVCCVDVYVESGINVIGGNSINFAAQCVRSGLKDISLLGAIGNDSYGEMIMDYLRSSSIEISHVHQLEGMTAHHFININEAGERYFKPNSWQGGVYETFLLSDDDWEFVKTFDVVATPINNPNLNEAIRRLTEKNKIVVDFLDYHDLNIIEPMLHQIDLGFISGTTDMTKRLQKFSMQLASPIVLTLGADGSMAFLNGKSYFQPAIPVEKVVDTTGCGDSYQAAFCVSWYRNQDLQTAMSAGADAASKILLKLGGI